MLSMKKVGLTVLLMIVFLFVVGKTLAQQSTFHTVCHEGSVIRFDVKAMPLHQLTDKIGMRFLTTSHFTVIQWDLKAGARLPPHSHLNEQVMRVLKGKLQAQSDNEVYFVEADEILVFPPYVPHGFVALTDVVMYEQQSPVRQDFLEADFIEKLSEHLKKNQ